jgi:RNA polymerase sigma factor (sigma-70 family)
MPGGRPDETRIGGEGRLLPQTRGSLVIEASSLDPARRRAAQDVIVRAYWKPCYAHVRRHWRVSNEDAKELVQGFFTRVFEHGLLARFDASKGSFRGFLRGVLENHVKNVHESERREKRGGAVDHIGLDEALEPADSALAPDEDLELAFEREWQRHVFQLGIEALRELCEREDRMTALAVLERYDLHDASCGPRPTYDDLARDLDIPSTQVTNYLHWARGKLRELVIAELRAVNGGDRQWVADVRGLLGGDAP